VHSLVIFVGAFRQLSGWVGRRHRGHGSRVAVAWPRRGGPTRLTIRGSGLSPGVMKTWSWTDHAFVPLSFEEGQSRNGDRLLLESRLQAVS